MYIYIKKDERGVVTNFEHVSDIDSSDWLMKFYDRDTVNDDLVKQGYIKTFLMESEYPIFQKYHDLYTYSDNSLHQPFNIVKPDYSLIQAQLGTVSAENQKTSADMNELKTLLKQALTTKEKE